MKFKVGAKVKYAGNHTQLTVIAVHELQRSFDLSNGLMGSDATLREWGERSAPIWAAAYRQPAPYLPRFGR